MNKEKKKINIVQLFSFSAVIILLVFLSTTQQNFLGKANLTNLLRDPSALMIMAAGMTMVLLLGSIDLSMGAVCSVSNVTYLRILLKLSETSEDIGRISLIAWACTLGLGLVSGFLLGVIHVKLKVPSFIASLGFMSVWQSAALLVTQNPESVAKKLWPAINWYKVTFGVVGLPIIIAAVITVIIFLVTRYTSFGKSIFAVGGNERAARVAGINVDATKITIFTINGLLASIAGIVLVANLRSSAPTVGDSYTLQIVASCALGGTSLAGGKGSVLGTILGVYTVTLINSGMTFMGIDAYWQNVVFGVFVLLAIAISTDRQTRGLIVK